MNRLITAVFKYLVRGLIFCAPIGVTIYVLIASFQWLDNLLPLDHYPGVGMAIVLAGLTLTGYIGSSFIVKPIFFSLEKLITKLPLVRIIYSSLKDLISAFVGDKKKFNQPVLVLLNKEASLYKLGFITQQNLDDLGIEEKVAVYLPHSYNFSGDLYIVPRENVTMLNTSATAIMKFIVSGGVVE
ncbi:DUF502 domain-containing protein [Cytophagaceae bacterium DM2B3-1]|uniref:DUF502 domain-containing protein n=2 Tax=Xanthocytophaga TaxID=3078918 RepID=A0AAE3U7U1_9BACT|nr:MULTISPECIES: DUF502 domain-containing protein [Xanthocytophaga]MDJ1469061.1 DUF502 domain-containing protein [Xanthocytophaga flavus]MDJ1481982.1 DUF502 domain-containing protein [Xanthocytophaga flavus]MDJ1492236.1 DUF502 domain-containing protein [Xanthocytophaga flavus]MDJ1499700.1 DUF502 domain-containing protein [Xanthocytophaga agilis]